MATSWAGMEEGQASESHSHREQIHALWPVGSLEESVTGRLRWVVNRRLISSLLAGLGVFTSTLVGRKKEGFGLQVLESRAGS